MSDDKTCKCKICGVTRHHPAAMTAHLGTHDHSDMYVKVNE